MTYAIFCENLTKSYGSFVALKSIDLQISEKSIFGIIGTSGAGKTTLLKLLSTLEKQSSGTLKILGHPVPYDNDQALRVFRQQIGVIFQNYQLLSALTVYENIALPLKILHIPHDEIHKKVERLLHLVGLENKKDLYPAHLSGGQKQRVAIARALISDPKILLCDEPTAALDPENTLAVLKLLKDIRDTLGTTIIMVTHEIGLIGSICDKIAIVHEGSVEEAGFVHDVFFNPQKQPTKKLLFPKQAKISDFFDESEVDGHRLFQLKFMGRSAKSPLISELVSQFEVHANILAGSIDKVGSTTLGHLIVSFNKNAQRLDDAIAFLQSQNVTIEELN